ncbi:ABC transporter ATP-binding protein [Paracoccus sediminilitoris]|uniref:ABC transporter ATP-binding protein n=1 Tax=Paracoccus sediminilitoris TaxID=2202419 RepID=UPI000DB98ABA|nr:ABC transporter ATP-binding protein [Paracoccus sediminilitoris]
MTEPTLQITGLQVQVGPHKVIDGVDITVQPGQIVALVGESGSGKSLTALSVMGLLGGKLRHAGGTISLSGKQVDHTTEAAMRALRGQQVSMIFQEPVASLNPLLSVGAQVGESLVAHGKADARTAWSRAIDMLRDVGIPEPEKRARQLPSQLSGGMCQRVMIASALIARPELLIADEPTTALDVTIQAQILELMRQLRERTGTAILFITHDLGVVAALADRVCVMYGGRIVEQADVDDLFDAPAHPYTRMLLATIPRLDSPRKKPLFSIPGTVPDHDDWPQGCRFRTRCPLASDHCLQSPPLEPKAPGHLAACWHSDQVAGMIDHDR